MPTRAGPTRADDPASGRLTTGRRPTTDDRRRQSYRATGGGATADRRHDGPGGARREDVGTGRERPRAGLTARVPNAYDHGARDRRPGLPVPAAQKVEPQA
ncbi:hypothetical protein GCM10010515_23610 [Streptomyces fructofermentans]|uniref:Uncharacterized protein n=1 Tax=Streptomyces fructofermentans TaxID=152141 RepID=A0A918NB32_9ACTN|nr:hypothetical protein GCM10010515_23610 [Streptomyces fructofermentans]